LGLLSRVRGRSSLWTKLRDTGAQNGAGREQESASVNRVPQVEASLLIGAKTGC
jgi:hypothetical protein